MGIERRQYLRLSSDVIARVRILIPEQTFTPFTHEAAIVDLSERGMKLITQDIDEAAYKMLLLSTRMVRITFTPPATQKAHTLFGKIVWVDYNNQVHPPLTQYGVSLEKINDIDKEVIQKCLETLSRKNKE